MKPAEQRRERILEYLVWRESQMLPPPTVRDIRTALSIASTSTVHSDLAALAEQGRIVKSDGLNRTVRLPGEAVAQVPVLGIVTAGEPIFATENIQQYLPVKLQGMDAKDLFALQIKGESMKDAGILDGDLVVVEKTPYAKNGEIVVALLEDSATVKRFFKENGGFRLQPENDDFEPILVDELTLLGRVVSVMRFYV